MKTHKERCIKAIEIIMKDRLIDRKRISCPLCDIYCSFFSCKGCPSASLSKYCYEGCMESKTFYNYQIDINSSMKTEARFKYWQKRLPLLKKVPTKYFTSSGFTKKAFYNIMKDD